jgi:hypothetical protein
MTAAEVLDTTDYYVDDLGFEVTPIVPVQDLPQLANYLGDKAYMYYSITCLPTNMDNWFIRGEQIVLSVNSPSYAKMAEITEFIKDALGRQDGSAQDVNRFASGKFTYHWVTVDYDIAAPARSEGGRMRSEITISYEFARDMTNNRFN